MGLDQYMYAAACAGQRDKFYESSSYDQELGEYVNDTVSRPIEIAYRRKHPNLHGWFETLWRSKGGLDSQDEDAMFNGVELELTWEDIDMLEEDINQGALPGTGGFFFGDDADDYYREEDLKFIREARSQLFLGLRVFYNSSW